MCIYVFRCVHSVESLASSVHSSTLSSSTCRHFCDGGQKHCRQHCALLLLSNMDSRHCMLCFYQQNNKGREIPFSTKTKKPVQLRNWRKKRKEKKVGDGAVNTPMSNGGHKKSQLPPPWSTLDRNASRHLRLHSNVSDSGIHVLRRALSTVMSFSWSRRYKQWRQQMINFTRNSLLLSINANNSLLLQMFQMRPYKL